LDLNFNLNVGFLNFTHVCYILSLLGLSIGKFAGYI